MIDYTYDIGRLPFQQISPTWKPAVPPRIRDSAFGEIKEYRTTSEYASDLIHELVGNRICNDLGQPLPPVVFLEQIRQTDNNNSNPAYM